MMESILIKKEEQSVMLRQGTGRPPIIIMNPEKVIAVVSGGLDSTTMLYHIIEQGYHPIVLTFHYGQKHKLEIEYAQATCDKLGLEHHVISIPALPGSSLTDKDVEVPKEDYSVETQKLTVVPNRNMVFLSVAASYAIAYGCKWIFYAAHHNDEAVYPDCTRAFVDNMNMTLNVATYKMPQIDAPFIDKTKAEIVKIGHELGVPFEDTWSCYDPVEVTVSKDAVAFSKEMAHCGVCGTCRERKNAFEESNVEDPTIYNR